MPRKKKTKKIAIWIFLAVILVVSGIFFFRFQQTGLANDEISISSAGPDQRCGSPDDTNVYVQGEKICPTIQLNPPSIFASLSYPSVPRILASGYAYDPTLRGFSCQTPPRILQLMGKENLNGVWQPSDKQFIEGGFSTYDAFGRAYADYYQCGPFVVLNGKIYNNEPLDVIDNKITQAQAEVYYTVCTDQSPQSSNRQYACEPGTREGITAIEFDVLPKRTEGFCEDKNDCIEIKCVLGTPEEECRNYDCINNACQLNVPTSSVYVQASTSIIPTTINDQVIGNTLVYFVFDKQCKSVSAISASNDVPNTRLFNSLEECQKSLESDVSQDILMPSSSSLTGYVIAGIIIIFISIVVFMVVKKKRRRKRK